MSVQKVMNAAGMCYKKLGNYDESVKDYTNAIKLDTKNGNFYYNRAISYMCLTPPDYEKALDDYNHAVEFSQVPEASRPCAHLSAF